MLQLCNSARSLSNFWRQRSTYFEQAEMAFCVPDVFVYVCWTSFTYEFMMWQAYDWFCTKPTECAFFSFLQVCLHNHFCKSVRHRCQNFCKTTCIIIFEKQILGSKKRKCAELQIRSTHIWKSGTLYFNWYFPGPRISHWQRDIPKSLILFPREIPVEARPPPWAKITNWFDHGRHQ